MVDWRRYSYAIELKEGPDRLIALLLYCWVLGSQLLSANTKQENKLGSAVINIQVNKFVYL